MKKKLPPQKVFYLPPDQTKHRTHHFLRMKKTSFSFRAVRGGSYLHHFFLGKMNSRRLRKAAMGVAASVCVSMAASAQCDTFRNADAANPLLSVFPKDKTIAGFAFADIDGDGDQDVYVDFLGKPKDHFDVLYLYKNVGTKTHPVFEEDTHTGFGRQRAGGQNGQMQFVDIDGDGDLDYYTSDSTGNYYNGTAGIVFFKNTGTPQQPRFINGPDDFLPPLTGSHFTQPFTFADVDGDGDYDFYAAYIDRYYYESFYQRVYVNTGTKQKPEFSEDKYVLSGDDGFLYRNYYDWNRDGLLDYFTIYNLGDFYGYYKNTGNNKIPAYVRADSESPVFQNGVPYRFADLNGDGFAEVFDFSAHYSTLAPVAVIRDSVLANGNKALYSVNHSAGYTYRWELNGKTIAGATKYYIIPKQPGIYTLYVSDECGTGVSLNCVFIKTNIAPALTDSRVTGSANINGITAKAYPNPFISTITLQLTGNPCTVQVVDVAGRVLLSQTTSAASLQVGQSLKAGTYIVQVWQGKEMIYKAAIVKQ